MQSQEITKFVDEFIFDDHFPGDYERKAVYVKEGIEILDANLEEEFGITFQDLSKESQKVITSSLGTEWKIYIKEISK